MDANTIWAIASGVAGAASGYLGGRVFGNSQSVEVATNVVELMKSEIEVLKSRCNDLATDNQNLRTELDVVKELVTQRADVEAVHETVREVKVTVDRIADKVGA